MARHADDLANDPVLVLINEGEPTATFDQWLASLDQDEGRNAHPVDPACLR